MQVEGAISDVLPMGPIAAKWRAFGWSVHEADGHDVPALLSALDSARATAGMPTVIVAKTIPGYPISFLRGQLQHYAKLTPEQADAALAELEQRRQGDAS